MGRVRTVAPAGDPTAAQRRPDCDSSGRRSCHARDRSRHRDELRAPAGEEVPDVVGRRVVASGLDSLGLEVLEVLEVLDQHLEYRVQR